MMGFIPFIRPFFDQIAIVYHLITINFVNFEPEPKPLPKSSLTLLYQQQPSLNPLQRPWQLPALKHQLSDLRNFSFWKHAGTSFRLRNRAKMDGQRSSFLFRYFLSLFLVWRFGQSDGWLSLKRNFSILEQTSFIRISFLFLPVHVYNKSRFQSSARKPVRHTAS